MKGGGIRQGREVRPAGPTDGALGGDSHAFSTHRRVMAHKKRRGGVTFGLHMTEAAGKVTGQPLVQHFFQKKHILCGE